MNFESMMVTPPQRPPNPKEAENQRLFQEAIEGDFTRIHEGIKFPIDVPGVVDVTVTRAGSTAQVHVFYEGENGKERHTTLTIDVKGQLIGRIPKELSGTSREDLCGAVLKGLKPFTSEFWIETEMDVIPPGQWPVGAKAVGNRGPGGKQPGIDPKRLEFLQHQPDALFGHITQKAGFKDYRLVFFPNYIILEHPLEENAAYFIDLPEGDMISLSDHPTRAEKEAVVAKYWHPDLQITKGQMIQRKFTRVEHKGDWMTEMQEEVDRRPKYKSGPPARP